MNKLPPKLGEEKKYPRRSARQNRALHLYFTMVATALNDAGLDMRVILKPEVDIPWSKMTVKDFLWRPIQRWQVQKKSTTELDTMEIDKVFNTLNRHLAKHGLHEAFPSIESLMEKMQLEDDARKALKKKLSTTKPLATNERSV